MLQAFGEASDPYIYFLQGRLKLLGRSKATAILNFEMTNYFLINFQASVSPKKF